MKPFKESTFILNGKHGFWLPFFILILLGIVLIVVCYVYEIGGYKMRALGPVALCIALILFFSHTKVSIGSDHVTVRWQILGLPIDHTVYQRENILRLDKTADGIQFYDPQQNLVRTIEGFDDQQHLEEVYAALNQWLATASHQQHDPAGDQSH